MWPARIHSEAGDCHSVMKTFPRLLSCFEARQRARHLVEEEHPIDASTPAPRFTDARARSSPLALELSFVHPEVRESRQLGAESGGSDSIRNSVNLPQLHLHGWHPPGSVQSFVVRCQRLAIAAECASAAHKLSLPGPDAVSM